ncbi:MAG: delta-60 repeat domain-containing protein [Verrucomicrobiia bacterium]
MQAYVLVKRDSNPASTARLGLALAMSFVALCVVLRAQPSTPLDPAFKPVITRPGGLVAAVAVQADGKIIIGGGFNAINGVARNGLARLNANGSVDTAFDPGAVCCGAGADAAGGFSAPISALLVQRDGKIVAGGEFSEVHGVARKGLARLNADGTLDASFDPGTGLASTSASGGMPPVQSILEQADGKLIVGGYFTAVNGVPRSGLVRLNANGSVDTTFDPGTALAIGFPDFGPITGMALLSNGQLLVAGGFQAFNDIPRKGLALLNPDGSLNPFDPAIEKWESPPTLSGLLVQTDGKILISGSFFVSDVDFRENLARLNPDGTLDLSYKTEFDPTNETYRFLALQPDGKILVHRQFVDTSGNSQQAIARLNPDGTPDSTYSVPLAPSGDARLQVLGVALQQGGGILVAGNLSPAPGSPLQGIVRADSAGKIDNSFAPQLELAEGFGSNVLAVASHTGGKVLIGGSFTRINGTPRNYLARLNADGSLDSSFQAQIESDEPSSEVAAILVQNDGKILIGGVFTGVNGTARSGVARLNSDGSLDTSFDPGSGTREDPAGGGPVGRVGALGLQADGKVLVAGSFTHLHGQPVRAFGRLNPDGTFDPSFISGAGDCAMCDIPQIRSVHPQTNGLIVVTGDFERVNGFVIPRLARILADGSVDPGFLPPVSINDEVTAAVVTEEGVVTVAMPTPSPSGEGSATRLLRLKPDGTPDAAFTPGEILGDNASAVPVSALALDAAGKLLIAGSFQSVGGVARHGLARLNTDGTLDTTFDMGAGFESGVFRPTRAAGDLVTSIALQNDGGIVVGGSFALANNQPRLGAARFQSGTPGPDPGGDGARLSIASRPSGGSVTLTLSGEAGTAYRIEASENLRNWTAIGTVTGAATPQSYVDNAASGPSRFYRAVAQ